MTKTLTVVFDVTGLSKAEIAALTTEVVVQGEPSDGESGRGGHREARVVLTKVEDATRG